MPHAETRARLSAPAQTFPIWPCVLGWGEVRDGGGAPRTQGGPCCGWRPQGSGSGRRSGPDHLRQVGVGGHLLLLWNVRGGALQGLVLRVCRCCGLGRGFLLVEGLPMGRGRKGSSERRPPPSWVVLCHVLHFSSVSASRSCNLSGTCPGPDPVYLPPWMDVTSTLGSLGNRSGISLWNWGGGGGAGLQVPFIWTRLLESALSHAAIAVAVRTTEQVLLWSHSTSQAQDSFHSHHNPTRWEG